jgi:hypothetical protein
MLGTSWSRNVILGISDTFCVILQQNVCPACARNGFRILRYRVHPLYCFIYIYIYIYIYLSCAFDTQYNTCEYYILVLYSIHMYTPLNFIMYKCSNVGRVAQSV